jgi:predicted Zn-dependent peptidase
MNWIPGTETRGTTKGRSSVVQLLFPRPETGVKDPRRQMVRWLTKSMFSHGITDSPLLREIRYRRSLAYSGQTTGFDSPDGGFFGFYVETTKPEEVLNLLKTQVLFDKRLSSRSWFDKVRSSLHNDRDMYIPSPSRDVDSICDAIVEVGEAVTEDTLYRLIDEISFEEVQQELDKMRSLDTSKAFIFEGGK